MNLLSSRWLFAVTAGMAAFLIAAAVPAQKEPAESDPAAVVNGVVITQKDYNRELMLYQNRLSKQGVNLNQLQRVKIRNEVLERLISFELLYQKSQNLGIVVEGAAIDGEIDTLRQNYQDQNEFEAALKSINLSPDDLKLQIKRRIAVQKLIDDQIATDVRVTDAESKAYYDQHPEYFTQPEKVRARHILIKVDPEASPEKKAESRKEIDAIQLKIKEGNDFADLAREYSQGPSGKRGGDLGFFERGQMVKAFEDAAFALKPNQVSKVVETQYGYHIIKVIEKKPAETVQYEAVKERLNEHIKQERIQQQVGQYIDTLRDSAEIERNL